MSTYLMATENDARTIGKSSGSYTSNLLTTGPRATTLLCTLRTSYNTGQIVKLCDLRKIESATCSPCHGTYTSGCWSQCSADCTCNGGQCSNGCTGHNSCNGKCGTNCTCNGGKCSNGCTGHSGCGSQCANDCNCNKGNCYNCSGNTSCKSQCGSECSCNGNNCASQCYSGHGSCGCYGNCTCNNKTEINVNYCRSDTTCYIVNSGNGCACNSAYYSCYSVAGNYTWDGYRNCTCFSQRSRPSCGSVCQSHYPSGYSGNVCHWWCSGFDACDCNGIFSGCDTFGIGCLNNCGSQSTCGCYSGSVCTYYNTTWCKVNTSCSCNTGECQNCSSNTACTNNTSSCTCNGGTVCNNCNGNTACTGNANNCSCNGTAVCNNCNGNVACTNNSTSYKCSPHSATSCSSVCTNDCPTNGVYN